MAADSPKMSDVVDPTTTSSILLLEWLGEQNWVGIEKDVILCGLWHAMQSTDTLNEINSEKQHSINNNSMGIEKDLIICSSQST